MRILCKIHKPFSFWLNHAFGLQLALESIEVCREYIESVNPVQHTRLCVSRCCRDGLYARKISVVFAIAFFGGGYLRAQTAPPQQIPNIAQAPASIQFSPWHEVDQSEYGTEYLEEFPSPVVSRYPNNNTVPVRIFMPINLSGPVPVVLVLHYWGATDLRNERELALELNRANIAAAVMTLPYHLSRTPVGRHSGDMAIQADPAQMVMTMSQAVLDVRRSLDFLAQRPEFDHTKLGLAGTSLGALVAELAYGVDSRVTQVAFVLGGVDLAHIVWSSSLLVRQRDALIRKGYTEDMLRDAIKPIEPLTYLPSRKTAPSLVIGGQYDTVIKQQSTQELIASLTDPKVLWLDTGHYGGIFVQRRLMREMARFFNQEFTGVKFVPPPKLYAPTIRLGLKVDTGNGFDIGAGLDLLKFDKKGDTFLTLFATPRGPQLFLGRDVSQGFSIGVIGSNHKSGLALLWSAVL